MYLFQQQRGYDSDYLAYEFTFHYVSISTRNAQRAAASIMHLHSTMYLFQLATDIQFSVFISIYIPLCIYFNDYSYVLTIDGTSFTFHYVSISTILLIISAVATLHLHSTMYLFQLQPLPAASLQQRYLHSTMYLFQQSFRPHLSVAKFYLHSTMYLFQLAPVQRLNNVMLFTFHYVSISTIRCPVGL